MKGQLIIAGYNSSAISDNLQFTYWVYLLDRSLTSKVNENSYCACDVFFFPNKPFILIIESSFYSCGILCFVNRKPSSRKATKLDEPATHTSKINALVS